MLLNTFRILKLGKKKINWRISSLPFSVFAFRYYFILKLLGRESYNEALTQRRYTLSSMLSYIFIYFFLRKTFLCQWISNARGNIILMREAGLLLFSILHCTFPFHSLHDYCIKTHGVWLWKLRLLSCFSSFCKYLRRNEHSLQTL